MPPVPYGLIAERRLVDRLLRANAVTSSRAQPLELQRGIERRRLKRLLDSGVIREASPERYYLDAPALADRLASRRRFAAIAMIGAILAVVGALIAGALGAS
jgi:hypothetical protein